MAEVTGRNAEIRRGRFRPYPEYRDSGVAWLGAIPGHWDVRRAAHRLAVRKRPVVPSQIQDQDVLHYSIPNVQNLGSGVVESGANIDSTKTSIERPLLLVSKLNPRKATIALAQPHETLRTLASTEFIAMEPRDCVLEFARYFYLSEHVRRELSARVDSATRSHQRCSPDDISKLPISWPPRPEQGAIAAFLDRETAKIDALVAKKKRLIELLQEKRTALITRAVTRGLDPAVPMKDSGVAWLGDIPAHWKPARLWRLCTAISGATPTRDNPEYWDGEIAWVSPKDMKRRMIATSEDLITQQAIDETGIKLIPPPVVLVVVRGMILAHTFPVAVTTAPVTINQDMKALRLADFVDPIYFAWALDGLGGGLIATVVEEAAHGTRTIRMDQWRSLVCPVPPRSEQDGISDFLKEKTANLDALIGKVREAIDRLTEYRTAVISAAVTGKIDVRKEAA